MEILEIIGVKSNITTFNYVCRLIVRRVAQNGGVWLLRTELVCLNYLKHMSVYKLRYLLQYLGNIIYLMIVWCVGLYRVVGKDNGRYKSTNALIYDIKGKCVFD